MVHLQRLNPMKRLPVILGLIAGILTADRVNAEILLTEQFAGYESGVLGTDVTLGTLNGWNLTTAEITVESGSGSLIGTNLGLVASAGDRAFISATETNANGAVIGARNQFAPTGMFPQSAETNIYYSFLYKFNNAADISTAGENIMQVNRANSGIVTPQHWHLVARNVGGQIQLGISKAGIPNNATNYAAKNIAPGETVFVVIRQHILPGTENDIYDLWINPPEESFFADEANVPAPDASIGADPADGAEDGSNTGPGRFVVFAGSNAEIDELRIGTTWADVTPFFGQCLPAAVQFTSETTVTQSADLAATFRVNILGTSPTVQWQVSTDSGQSWDDVPGATATIFKTPNLTVAQNGIQYRAIASVECDSSSATSVVATVIVTNPIVTSPGVIMHDTFLDPELGFDDRANEPLTSSNSLWYTAATDNLTAFNQGGNLLGIPLSGSSSLWLGYFIAPDEPPVHLDVGRALKVTLPFIPGSYSSHTQNASLRIGVFDYHDAGTRITADAPNVGGSQGLGSGVRGYLLNVDFGPTFSGGPPLELYARSFLADNNLMGAIGDFDTLGEMDGDFEGAPAFQAGTQYTLEFIIARTGVNSMEITASITGGGTNWTLTVTDTQFVYPRFDSVAIRPNSLETSADSFTFPEFIVEVIEIEVPFAPYRITEVSPVSPDMVKLTWESVPGVNYHLLSSPSLTTPVWTTNATIQATGGTTSYTNALSGDTQFYRILAD